MKKSLLAVVFFAFLFGVAVPSAYAGGEVRISLGGNFCIENDKTNCKGTDFLGKSASFTLSSGWRFFEYVGLYLDLGVAGLGGKAVEKGAALHVMPTIRGYIPFSMFEAYGGFGIGYAGFMGKLTKGSVEDGGVFDATLESAGLDRAFTYYSLWSMKFNLGISFKLFKVLGLGLNMEYILTSGGKVKMFKKTSSVEANEISDMMTVQGLVFFKF